jgi:hypothetical protein
MKVTVDTRHDSLEEALATIHAAFGSITRQPAPVPVAKESATPLAATRPVAKRSGSRKPAAARPGSNRPRAMKATTKIVAADPPAPLVDVSAAPANRTHVAAPSAETSPRTVPTKNAAKGASKAVTVKRASGSKSSATTAPAKKVSARHGRRSMSSMNPSSNIAPPGQADAIRAWAKTQGMDVKQAGRLPAVVIQAYQEWPDH